MLAGVIHVSMEASSEPPRRCDGKFERPNADTVFGGVKFWIVLMGGRVVEDDASVAEDGSPRGGGSPQILFWWSTEPCADGGGDG